MALTLTDAPIKPKLRGVSHGVAFFIALICGGVLVASAPGSTAKLACAVYAASLCMLLGVSALYHLVTWSTPEGRQRMRRLDHSAIFVLIAGTYTPLAFTLEPVSTFRMLAVAWAGAALGVLKALFWVQGPKWIVAVLAVAVGWLAVFYAAPLFETIGLASVLWMAAGGVIYSLGALVYAVKRPDPWPIRFGYHEVFHALVIAAAICHFIAVSRSLGAMRGS
jgi:hemolysin III